MANRMSKAPAVSVVAVVTIALAIGATSTIFTLLDGTLLRAPFPDAGKLVGIFNRFPNLDRGPASFPDFLEWKRQSRSFTGISAHFLERLTFTGAREPVRISGSLVSADYFRILGIGAQLGRLFTPNDHSENAAPVCVISDQFWRREFHGSRDVLGRVAILDGVGYSIIGVLRGDTPSFSYPEKTEVWIPLEPRAPYKVHGTNYLDVIGRLRAGVNPVGAHAELEAIQNDINREFPDNKHTISIYPLTQILFGNTRRILVVLFAATGLVLLIASANLANLLLADGAARSKEFAIRQALGAERRHLIRHSLKRSFLVVVAGAVLGFALAPAGCRFVLAIAPRELRLPERIGLDWRIAAFSIALVFMVTLAAGIVPALRASRVHLEEALRVNTVQTAGTRGRLGSYQFFVVAEIALTTVLLGAAFLVMESLWHLVHTNAGFNPDKVLAMQISLPEKRYGDANKQIEFFERLLEHIRNIPGVSSAGAIVNLPIADGGTTGDFTIEGRPKPKAGEEVFARKEIVAPGYFETMKIPLVAGRFFNEHDRMSERKVVILNERMAKQFWPGQNAVGQRLDLGLGKENEWQEIVGVVGDVKTEGLGEPTMMTGYLCSQQYPSPDMAVVTRASIAPTGLVSSLRAAVRSIDNQQPVSQISFMDQVVHESLSVPRSLGYVLSAFAALALLLAIIGVYGLLAYSVTQRVQEIGVRMALGADRSMVIYSMLKWGVKLAAAGLAIGLVVTESSIQLIRHQLFGVTPADPIALAAVVSVLGISCLAACYIPARRAASIDPMKALRIG